MTARIPEQVAGTIDYTDVRKDVTYADIERICLEAVEHQLGAVVVPSALVRRAAACLAGTDVVVSCYVGHPFGTQAAVVKAREAEAAVEHGATELDVVLHHGTARAARWPEVEAELATVKNAAGPTLLKLVVEVSILTDDELSTVARTAADAGYAMIANTAGFADRLSPPKDRSGIFEETELSLRLAVLGSRLESSFDAPTAGQRQEFQDLKAAVYQEFYKINRFFKEDFPRFIQEVRSAGFSIFPKIEPITIKE